MLKTDNLVTRALTVRCLFALAAVAALALANFVVLREEIRANESGVELLTVSGRQRTLLQSTALLAQALVSTYDPEERAPLRQELLEALEPLESAHHRLVQFDAMGTGDPPPEVQEIYESTPWLLDIEVRNYLTHLRELARGDDAELTLRNPHYRYIRDVALSRHVMDGLDAVVAAYQQQSEARAAQLRALARWSLSSTLVVLGLTGALVFRPMVRRVRHDMAALQDLNETLEERVAERTAQMLHAERLAAVGEMVTGVAHESRNALQQIGACAKMLEWEVNGRGEAAGLISDVQKAHDRLHRLFENLRGYVSPLTMEKRVSNVQDVFQEAWKTVAPLRDGRDVALDHETGGLDLRCMVDPFQMEQVFRNILENSLAACDDPVRIGVSWRAAEFDGQPALAVTIADNGPGLTPEAARRMFEPFYTTRTQGTGLGMAIVQRIVEAHGGRIEPVGQVCSQPAEPVGQVCHLPAQAAGQASPSGTLQTCPTESPGERPGTELRITLPKGNP